MTVDKRLVGSFAEELYLAESLEKRFQVYGVYVQRLGFEGATYTFLPGKELELRFFPPVFLHTDPYPTDFLEHYACEQLERHDFTIRNICQNHLDLMDWQEHERHKLLTPEERRVVMLAREDYGIVNALSIPTMYKETGMAGVSIISSEKDALFGLLKEERQATLTLCTKMFHDRNFASAQMPHVFALPFLTSLKPKDICILRYLASGGHFKNIEDHTGISYRYACKMTDELRGRLGNITRDKMMYLAGLLSLFDYE